MLSEGRYLSCIDRVNEAVIHLAKAITARYVQYIDNSRPYKMLLSRHTFDDYYHQLRCLAMQWLEEKSVCEINSG